jgi:hypothetical protein
MASDRTEVCPDRAMSIGVRLVYGRAVEDEEDGCVEIMNYGLEELDEPLGVHGSSWTWKLSSPRWPMAETILTECRTAELTTTGVCPTGAQVVPACVFYCENYSGDGAEAGTRADAST